MPALSDRLLSERMKELEARGIVERRVERASPARVEYELTRMGRDLAPALGRAGGLGAALAGRAAASPRCRGPLAAAPWPTSRTTARRRQGARPGARHPLHPALVHRHPGPAEVVLDQRRAARRRLRGRHGLRRLLDHRLQRDRGVRHDRDARPDDVRGAAVAPRGRGRRRRAHVLRHPDARSASPTRAIRATSCAARSSAPSAMGFDALQRRPRARVLPVPGQQAAPRCSTRAATSTSRRSTPAPTCAARPCSRSSSSASTSSTPTTRSARASTRSTCATPTR